jgi:signal peptidase II
MTSTEEHAEVSSLTLDDQEESGADVQAQSYSREKWILFIVAGMVLLLDYITKEIVRNNMPLYTYWAPFPALEQFFRITHTSNTGVAFGLFQNANLLFAVFASVVSIGIMYFNQKLEPGHAMLRLALGLQLGGALGNLIDRLTQGYVTDFLDFGPWPVFNVADTAVVAGVILMGYLLLQEERRDRAAQLDAGRDDNQPGDLADVTNHDEGTAS